MGRGGAVNTHTHTIIPNTRPIQGGAGWDGADEIVISTADNEAGGVVFSWDGFRGRIFGRRFYRYGEKICSWSLQMVVVRCGGYGSRCRLGEWYGVFFGFHQIVRHGLRRIPSRATQPSIAICGLLSDTSPTVDSAAISIVAVHQLQLPSIAMLVRWVTWQAIEETHGSVFILPIHA
ncbi:hypothetical protein PIB30_005646 [Stylosanthes scabra]|uniref:Uncharacterized protein n=1 Tax=Stylosanthes scabra TaxID=79078 RepID=A0ABU6T4S6_9FABA|nr:hypothetical protein [Stylosanthes scabra]